MNTPADLYADWDGAYVLGALSPADRRDYERHLNDCVACSQAVAHLVGLPGLLAQVPLDQALQLDQPVDSRVDAAPSATLLPRLVQAARAHTRRARLLAAGAVVAGAPVPAYPPPPPPGGAALALPRLVQA
ncbi:MAG: zf-HC2 domain-containing protein, partial [Ramlibacter sp.]|nr:zf-HC2 domain-containing protein [Cryobacterium sp.]